MIKSVIVDLDGTLCNTDHRQHFMKQTPKDWKSFYANLSKDKPNKWCLDLIYQLHPEYTIIFVSGRPSELWQETMFWLNDFITFNYELFMRPSGDFRKDSIVKIELYNNSIKPKYDVQFCIDDRKQVVDAWREIGLTCLQCAEGNF